MGSVIHVVHSKIFSIMSWKMFALFLWNPMLIISEKFLIDFQQDFLRCLFWLRNNIGSELSDLIMHRGIFSVIRLFCDDIFVILHEIEYVKLLHYHKFSLINQGSRSNDWLTPGDILHCWHRQKILAWFSRWNRFWCKYLLEIIFLGID